MDQSKSSATQQRKFYDLKLDPQQTVTAFIVRVQAEAQAKWQDYYVNNWFHPWGAETDLKVLPLYANEDPNYTVYGYLKGIAAPFNAAGVKLLQQHGPDYSGIIYHARVVEVRTAGAAPDGTERQDAGIRSLRRRSLEAGAAGPAEAAVRGAVVARPALRQSVGRWMAARRRGDSAGGRSRIERQGRLVCRRFAGQPAGSAGNCLPVCGVWFRHNDLRHQNRPLPLYGEGHPIESVLV